ncbi:MAG: methyltransferase [Flavobacteriaceae bacterium]|nr:methyltransferase [Flavobacteriaceae bacterium]
MHNKRGFFKEAIKNIKISGSIVPSSKFLTNAMLKNVDFENAKVIVEFGPGNGIITYEILKRMRPDAVLICFEVNKQFYEHLNKINDKRLIVLNVSAENIKSEINNLGFTEIDCCISSLPLTNIPNIIGKNILINTRQVLKTNGHFSQFQYSLSFFKKLKSVFNKKNVKIKFEVLNIPPAFIYNCKKI